MKKYVQDLRLVSITAPREGYALLRLQPKEGLLPDMVPGQFVEVLASASSTTFLRRPISINFVDRERNELWLLVHAVGDGTRSLAASRAGDLINCVYPLGNGFTVPEQPGESVLLVGGGVGTAPLLYYGKALREKGHTPVFLLGGRRAEDLMQLDLFQQYGEVYVTTEDGSLGEKGFVTDHSLWGLKTFDRVATCGPKPMMQAVARRAAALDVSCEASLENLMACGLGACLCCVEKTADDHHVCVCKEGPVFNTEQLKWPI